MACNGIAGGNIGVHLGGHDNAVFGRKDNEDQTDGAFLTSVDGSKNEFASNLSPEFREATEKKPGGIFT